MQAGHAVGRWPAVARQPGVEAEVMVVAARGHEQHVAFRAPAGNVAGLHDHVEAHDPDVEVAHAIDVGCAQVHVADAYLLVDRHVRFAGGLDRTLRAAHDATSISTALLDGSRTRKPSS